MSASRFTAADAPRASMLTLVLTVALLTIGAATAGAQSENSNSGPWVAPERAARQTNPSTPTANVIKNGRSLFTRECEKCHGKAGHGDGPQAAYLETKPMDLSSNQIRSQSDGALFYKITEGRGQMPKAKLNDNEKWAVIEYLRTLAPRN